MKRLLITLSLLATFISATATDCCQPLDYSFYIKVDSGISFADCAEVCASYPPWNPATQGYNSALGKSPIASLSVGCELAHALDLEVTLANRSTFNYRKFQTPTAGGASYIRNFDLDVTSIMFSANLLGQGIPPYLNCAIGCGKLYPLIGAGLGASNLLITNFRTTGLAPSGDSSPYASFEAENQYTRRRAFTYTVLAGFEYNHDGRWAVATGYRWFDAGCFKGPQYLRVASGAAVDVGCDNAWKMRFRANEWFIEFKIFM